MALIPLINAGKTIKISVINTLTEKSRELRGFTWIFSGKSPRSPRLCGFFSRIINIKISQYLHIPIS